MRYRLGKYSFLGVIAALFLYSYTQVNLSLTLSQSSIWQSIQKSFQYIGYFNRPLSTWIFIGILILMFIYYIWFLKKAIRKQISKKEIFIISGVTAAVLSLSYNAFSYDLFNYIFDAKIITFYNENPYLHKALDYPGDPMLSFMQWTHRVYPYGPIWLVLTAPISFLGFNIFMVTFFLFKFLIAGFYLGSVFVIYKINQKINPETTEFNTAFFALSPLVIIESLVSSHNDIVMIFFALLGIWAYILKKKVLALVLIVISSQVKIPTIAILAPLVLSFPILRLKMENTRFFQLCVAAMVAVLLYVLTRIEIQPWYFLWILPFLALLKPNKYVIGLSIGLSAGLLLRYTVFLYNGNWDGIGVPLRNGFTILFPLVSVFSVFFLNKIIILKRATR